eukprot:118336-Prymnesium_polylepis.1
MEPVIDVANISASRVPCGSARTPRVQRSAKPRKPAAASTQPSSSSAFLRPCIRSAHRLSAIPAGMPTNAPQKPIQPPCVSASSLESTACMLGPSIAPQAPKKPVIMP